MWYDHYSGTIAQYIREYLDRDGHLDGSCGCCDPSTEDEARITWRQLEHAFREDGGTGIDEEDFVESVMDGLE